LINIVPDRELIDIELMKRTILMLLVCLSVCLPSCKFARKKGWIGGKKSDTLLVWQARQESIRRADSLKAIQEAAEAMERARLDALNQAEQERLAYEARFKYHVIVGSFITPEYARAYQEFIQKEGYTARILQKPDSRFELISAESHESLRKAVDRMMQFRDTVAYDAWIYIRH
jgi:hypothetical protein